MKDINNNLSKIMKEIEEKLESLIDTSELTSDEALSRANEIVKMINKIIEIGTENPAELYKKAEIAYLLAAEKVPITERDMVAFPSNYWSMRADEERLNIIKSLAPPLKIIPKLSPSLVPNTKIPSMHKSLFEIPQKKETQFNRILKEVIEPTDKLHESFQAYQKINKQTAEPEFMSIIKAYIPSPRIDVEKVERYEPGLNINKKSKTQKLMSEIETRYEAKSNLNKVLKKDFSQVPTYKKSRLIINRRVIP